MNSSQNINLINALHNDVRTVFRLKDVAMLVGETNFDSLNQKLNYCVRTGKLLNPRKGIYCKLRYDLEELSCRLFSPSYISLEYVLQKAGVIFQYDSRLTMVSYLSRTVEVINQIMSFRKIKNELLVATEGIEQKKNTVNIATPERAFLDMIYLNGAMYFDNLNPLNRDKIEMILPIYNSKILKKRVENILKND